MIEGGNFIPEANGHSKEAPKLADLVELPSLDPVFCVDVACEGLNKVAEITGHNGRIKESFSAPELDVDPYWQRMKSGRKALVFTIDPPGPNFR